MDIALAQLALIFLPGIIWANLDATYGAGPKVELPKLALNSFLFGIATYSALYLLYSIFQQDFSTNSIQTTDKFDLPSFADEILWSIPTGLFLSILWLYGVRHRLVMKFLHLIGATTRFGSEDVWSFTFNSTQAHVEYVHIRDIQGGFVFAGWVNAYSETEDVREILLKDVIVYDDEGVEISTAPHLYLSRPKSNIWVEFPYAEET